MSEPAKEETAKPADNNNNNKSSVNLGCSIGIDTTYLKSLEGILRLISIPVSVLGVILTIAALIWGPGGWYFFVGVSYLIYVGVVIFIEVCISGFHVHRLIDGIVMLVYTGLWLLSALINIALAAVHANVLLGIGAAFAIVSGGLCLVQSVFSFRTWKSHERERGESGSRTIYIF